MRWLKHYTDSRRDPKLLAVKREFGLAGIGLYWLTVEAVAEQYEKGREPSLSLDLASWREITGISPQMMRKWAAFGDEIALFSAAFSEKTLTISIKKIKDIRDNYTRDCQATAKQEEEGEEKGDKKESSLRSDSPLEPTPKTSDSPVFIHLTLNDGSHYPITEEDIARWSALYPAVDIRQALRNMAGWCEANPTKRKTSRGITRFITSWLSREQDRGGSLQGQRSSQARPMTSFQQGIHGANVTARRIMQELNEQNAGGQHHVQNALNS